MNGLQGYWQRQIEAQQQCKNTEEEPIPDHTLKRIALGHLRKIGPLQSKVTKWEREKDPNKKASFIELRDWFSAEERILRRNRQALGEIGIANSVEIKPELDSVNLQLEAHQEALQKIIQHQREVQQAMNVTNKENEPVAPTKESSNDNDKILEKILAALVDKKQEPKSEKETKLEQLEKQIKALKQGNNGGGNSKKGKVGPQERKPVKKMKCYCSTHGVNPTHENDNCNTKQSWHKDGATFENKKGGNTYRANLWHDASITLEQCYMDKIE